MEIVLKKRDCVESFSCVYVNIFSPSLGSRTYDDFVESKPFFYLCVFPPLVAYGYLIRVGIKPQKQSCRYAAVYGLAYGPSVLIVGAAI